MALAISGIPMLTGDEALAFRERAEETLKKRVAQISQSSVQR